MKKRIALGATLLLTLGTAVAGTILYGHEQAGAKQVDDEQSIALPSDTRSSQNESAEQSVTPEMIAMWKASAASTDYESPKAPI